MSYELDEVDRGILHLLQNDARRITSDEMAERVGVSASTVRNRITNLEDAGIIQGYYPDIDYDRAGYPLHVLFLCSATPADRDRVADQALSVSGVIGVDELIDGDANVFVEAIATDPDATADIYDELAGLGLTITRTLVYREQYVQPFDQFAGAADDAPPDDRGTPDEGAADS